MEPVNRLSEGSVLVKGSSIGTVTDVDGNYTLSNVPADGVLEFSLHRHEETGCKSKR